MIDFFEEKEELIVYSPMERCTKGHISIDNLIEYEDSQCPMDEDESFYRSIMKESI